MNSSIIKIKKFLEKKKFKKIFVITGKQSFTKSGAKNLFSNLLLNKQVIFFFKQKNFPELSELKKILVKLRSFKPDLILAIGGGSVIDYAKIANVTENRKNIKNLIRNYSYPIKKKFTKLVVVPTTAGSGAEVTSNAVIYVNGIKYSFENKLLTPDFFFLLPELILNASYKIKASSGFDAIAQATESLLSLNSNKYSINYASKSLKISLKNFYYFLKSPNKENSKRMLIASNLAGRAINISKTTAPHAISYPFTSLYNVSHGHAVSLFFENIMRFNFDKIEISSTKFDLYKRFKLIFDLYEVSNIDEFYFKLIKIKKIRKLTDNFKRLKIFEINPKQIIKGVNLLRLKNNPVKIDKIDLIKIIKQKTI